jgi:hypothetical protein
MLIYRILNLEKGVSPLLTNPVPPGKGGEVRQKEMVILKTIVFRKI